MKRRKPTRRDLLVVIGRLQDYIGSAQMAYENDRDQFGLQEGRRNAALALDLCIEVRSQDDIVDNTGPWST